MSSRKHSSQSVEPHSGKDTSSKRDHSLSPAQASAPADPLGPGLPPPPGFDLKHDLGDENRARTLIGLPEDQLKQLREVIPAAQSGDPTPDLEGPSDGVPQQANGSEPYSIDLSLLPDSDDLESLGLDADLEAESDKEKAPAPQMPGLDLSALDLDSIPLDTSPLGAPDEDALPAPGSFLPTPGSQLPTPSAAAPALELDLPTPGSDLPSPGAAAPALELDLPAPGADLPAPGTDLPAPGIDLPNPMGSPMGANPRPTPSQTDLPSAGSQLPAPGSQLPSVGSQLPAPGGQLPSAGSQLPAPGGQLPSAGSQLPAPGGQLPGFPSAPLPAPGGHLPSSAAPTAKNSSASPPPLRALHGGAAKSPPPLPSSRSRHAPPPVMRSSRSSGGPRSATSAALASLADELPGLDDLDSLDANLGANPVKFDEPAANAPDSSPSSATARPASRLRKPHLRRSGPLRDLAVVGNGADQDLEGSHQLSSVVANARRGGRMEEVDDAVPSIGDLDLDLGAVGAAAPAGTESFEAPRSRYPSHEDNAGSAPLEFSSELPSAAHTDEANKNNRGAAAYYPNGSPAPKATSGGSSRRLIWGATALFAVVTMAGVGGWYTGFFDQFEDTPVQVQTVKPKKKLDPSKKQLLKLAKHGSERDTQTLAALFSGTPQSYSSAIAQAAAKNDVVGHVELTLLRALRHPEKTVRNHYDVQKALKLSSHFAKNPNGNVARVFALAKLQAGDAEGAEAILSNLDSEEAPAADGNSLDKTATKDSQKSSKKSSRSRNKKKRRSKSRRKQSERAAKAEPNDETENDDERLANAAKKEQDPKIQAQRIHALVPYYRAIVALEQHRSDDAKRHLQKALAFYPEFQGAQVLQKTLDVAENLSEDSLHAFLKESGFCPTSQNNSKKLRTADEACSQELAQVPNADNWALEAAYFAYRSGLWNEAEAMAKTHHRGLRNARLRDDWGALKIRLALARGDYSTAIRDSEEVLKRDPKSQTFQSLRLEAALAAKKFESVQVLTEHFMAKSNATPEIWLSRAQAHAALGKGDLALAELDRVTLYLAKGQVLPKNLAEDTKAAPPTPEAKDDPLYKLPKGRQELGARVALLRARVYAMRKRTDLAQRYFEIAQELNPLATIASAELADLLQKSEQSQLAKASFEKARVQLHSPKTLEEKNATAALKLAQARFWFEHGSQTKAWEYLHEAEKIQPMHPETQLELALQYRRKGYSDKSQKTLLALQETVGRLPGMSAPLTEVYLQTKQLDKLEDLIGTQLSNPQASMELLLSGARLRLAQGQVQKASDLVERILIKEPDQWEARLIKAQIFYTEGEIQSALSEINRSQPQRPNATRTLWLGKIHAANGNTKAAYSHYETAARQQPGWAEPKIFMAKTLAERGSARKAIAILQPILRQHKNEADAHLAMGIAHRDLRQFDVALRYFRQAQRLSPGHYQAFYEEGRIENNRNQHRDAIRALEHALDAHSPALPFNFRLDALRRLGTSYVSIKDRSHAQATLEKFLVEAPSNDPAIPSVRRLLRSL